MDKNALINKLKKLGYEKYRAIKRLKEYVELSCFTYKSVYKGKGLKNDYKSAFGDAYDKYGLYIFYEAITNEVLYVGEAASEPFSNRLSQHFNQSHGGLREKFKADAARLQRLENSNILVLYIKKGSPLRRTIHFDEDLLIGLLCPEWNDR